MNAYQQGLAVGQSGDRYAFQDREQRESLIYREFEHDRRTQEQRSLDARRAERWLQGYWNGLAEYHAIRESETPPHPTYPDGTPIMLGDRVRIAAPWSGHDTEGTVTSIRIRCWGDMRVESDGDVAQQVWLSLDDNNIIYQQEHILGRA